MLGQPFFVGFSTQQVVPMSNMRLDQTPENTSANVKMNNFIRSNTVSEGVVVEKGIQTEIRWVTEAAPPLTSSNKRLSIKSN